MNRLPEFIDPHLIWIRNFPSDFLAREIEEFINICFTNTTATLVSITNKHSALVRFSTTLEPKHYIRELHQRPVKDRLLSVTYAKKLSNNNVTTAAPIPSRSSTEIKHNFSEFVKRLYATHSLFEQPPPPHLRYVYPKANRDILDAITIALETTPKLYTQVLHLMNRMNLEPPFIVGSKNLVWPSTTSKSEPLTEKLVLLDACTQTDRLSNNLLASDESELESETSDVELQTKKRKREKFEKLLNSKRMRSILQSAQSGYANKMNGLGQTHASSTVLEEAFEVGKSLTERSIVINVPAELTHSESTLGQVVGSINVAERKEEIDSVNKATDSIEKRLSVAQMQSHPLFQNYSPGEPSNKLYLKNLSKDVEEEDLRGIYSRFIDAGQSLDIRVMKSGRMKGQAFVCFNDPYMDDESGYKSVEKALRETNGLIVKDKVIVVMFGKR
ncbi:U11/U12 small nuclear ribonucleoprotein 65 kDa protein [Pseudolycoriella hygida]|uniref:U11/U12 small nuclear ribonucleoprotein 65 kDa protein n=1 Tax=Pseudolycoriella hygida TaxID=35572 RepID=A0A9Q0MMH2_9DIPT|nr:U11/U12 small nuclear ribonucleoprotein 65 kDa protein [Pseudolycoriella hygida]